MTLPKDLPPGAMAWARDLERKAETVKHLETVVQNLTNLLGLDYRNPTRGISAGSSPSVQNPLKLKLNALNDMDVRNAQEGDFIAWDSTKNMWVPRRPPGAPFDAMNLFNNPVLAAGGPDGLPARFTNASESEWEFDLTNGVLTILPVMAESQPFQGFDFTEVMAGAGMVDGTAYIFSMDVTINTGTAPSANGFVSMNDGIYPYANGIYGVYVDNDPGHIEPSIPYVTTFRLHMPFTYTPDEFMECLFRWWFDGMVDYFAKVSNFSLVETIALPYTNYYNEYVPSTNLMGMVTPGVPYVLSLGETYKELVGTLSVVADGVEVQSWTFPSNELADHFNKTFTIPVGTVAATLEATGEFLAPIGLLPALQIAPEPVPFFSGNTPADANYIYSWAGTPDNSASIRTPR